MTSRFSRRSALALLALGLLAREAPASAQSETAEQFVTDKQVSAQTLLQRPASDARSRELSRLFEDMLDYEELSRRSLSRHWNDRTPAQRTEFVTLLRQLVERAYQTNLERTLRFVVEVTGSEVQGDATVVHTRAQSRDNRRAPAVEVDYSLRQSGGRWRVFDIHTDGVSLVANYRAQFNRIIGRDGWDGLISTMRSRAADGSSDL